MVFNIRGLLKSNLGFYNSNRIFLAIGYLGLFTIHLKKGYSPNILNLNLSFAYNLNLNSSLYLSKLKFNLCLSELRFKFKFKMFSESPEPVPPGDSLVLGHLLLRNFH